MKKVFLFMLSLATLFACNNDDDGTTPPFEGDSEVYDLNAVSDSGVSGKATFTENEDNSVTVVLDLDGTTEGNMHPAHIHFNSAAETGAIAISLEPVNGATGMSTTIITKRDDGTAITYEELVNFDGYINVHLSAENLNTLVAQGDIGVNELTGESVTYDLNTRDVEGINGSATFEKRASGETLITLELTGTPEGGVHPAHIHEGSVADAPGEIVISLNDVDGDTGISKTNVSETDAGDAISYTDLLEFDGYVNVHLSADQLDVIVAQGDIGSNGSPWDY